MQSCEHVWPCLKRGSQYADLYFSELFPRKNISLRCARGPFSHCFFKTTKNKETSGFLKSVYDWAEVLNTSKHIFLDADINTSGSNNLISVYIVLHTAITYGRVLVLRKRRLKSNRLSQARNESEVEGAGAGNRLIVRKITKIRTAHRRE